MAINKEIKNCFDTMLLNEHYFLRSRIGFGGTLKYGLYDERINIKAVITDTSFREIKKVLQKKKDDKYFISRSLIRKLHGKSYFKHAYKEFMKAKKYAEIYTTEAGSVEDLVRMMIIESYQISEKRKAENDDAIRNIFREQENKFVAVSKILGKEQEWKGAFREVVKSESEELFQLLYKESEV